MREQPVAAEYADPASSQQREHQHWAARLAALGDLAGLPPRLQSFAAATRQQFQALLRENAVLAGQVADLEGQLRDALDARDHLVGQVSELADAVAALRREREAEQAALDRLGRELDLGHRPARGGRQPIPLRPPSDAPRADRARGPVGVLPAPSPGRPAIDDDEVLLGEVAAEPLAAPFAPAAPRHWSLEAVAEGRPTGLGTGSYALIAQPFARFSDLGQFQAAIQSLLGVHNVRVRRFAQGTLEMRVDYDGVAPLTEALRALPLPVDEIIQEDLFRLRVRLTSAGAN